MGDLSASAEKPTPLRVKNHDSFNGGLLSEIAVVPLDRIRVAGSPRTEGEDQRHLAALAEIDDELPPIVVHRQTMTVIDGVHRLRAAECRGATSISVVYFNGDDREAFVLAVRLNSSHGLPLSLGDRKAAAGRILADYPEWSNRKLAEVAGLSDKTVAALRRRSGAENPHPTGMRIGRDGVAYPLSGGDGRRAAEEFLAANPGASAQEVALAAGISLTTAKDVRRRVRAGQGTPAQPGGTTGRGAGVGESAAPQSAAGRRKSTDMAAIVQRLQADPSLRFTEVGRKLLRTLTVLSGQTQDMPAMANSLPMHCAPMIVDLARQHAESWQLLAESLTERINCRETEYRETE